MHAASDVRRRNVLRIVLISASLFFLRRVLISASSILVSAGGGGHFQVCQKGIQGVSGRHSNVCLKNDEEPICNHNNQNIVDIGTGSWQQTYRIDRALSNMPRRFTQTQCWFKPRVSLGPSQGPNLNCSGSVREHA